MSAFHVDLGQLDGQLVAVDGFEIVSVTGRRFPIAVAQRLDIRLAIPRMPAAHPVLAVLEGENSQTEIVLLAGRAPITRLSSVADMASAALTLDLESRLRATKPLEARQADRVHTLNLTGQMAGYAWSLNNVSWNNDASPARYATPCWCRPAAGLSSRSMRITRGFGRSIAICFTTSRRECSRRFVTCDEGRCGSRRRAELRPSS